ncbi:TonB family protein, partial [Luteimonas aestuarii]
SGEVQVEFTVGVDGSVTNARVVRANPPRVFDREAVAAVRRWRFEPVAAPVTTRRAIAFDPGS